VEWSDGKSSGVHQHISARKQAEAVRASAARLRRAGAVQRRVSRQSRAHHDCAGERRRSVKSRRLSELGRYQREEIIGRNPRFGTLVT
jgi:hypothetical protein